MMSDLISSVSIRTLGTVLVGFGSILLIVVFLVIKRTKQITVSEIWIYPIKSCKGIKLQSSKVVKTGFKYDRQFMLIDDRSAFVSQRKYGNFCKMALIEQKINEDEGVLEVCAPGMSVLKIPLVGAETNILIKATVWGYECDCIQVLTSEHNKWFGDYLEVEGLTLVRMADNFTRYPNKELAPNGQTSFVDQFPFLLASQSSIEDLTHRVGSEMSLSRFRPNIVVVGSDPWEEDKWVDLQFHSVSLGSKIDMKSVKPCMRCPVPNIDPVSAIPNEYKEPSKSMKSFRSGEALGLEKIKWKGQLFFGVQVDHSSQENMTISVGDELKLPSGKKSQWFIEK